MACTYFQSKYVTGSQAPRGHICGKERHRLLVDRQYITLAWHDMLGPDFYFVKGGGNEVYEPAGENDPIWPVFKKWLDKRRKIQAVAEARSSRVNAAGHD